jgi:hypothetical protein
VSIAAPPGSASYNTTAAPRSAAISASDQTIIRARKASNQALAVQAQLKHVGAKVKGALNPKKQHLFDQGALQAKLGKFVKGSLVRGVLPEILEGEGEGED